MTTSIVLLIEFALIALLLLLAFRMLTLVRNDPFIPATAAAYSERAVHAPSPHPITPRVSGTDRGFANQGLDKCELITRLHILLSIQERDCREKGLELDTAPHAVKEYVAVWLYGAACTLCDKSQRHSDSLVYLVSQLISRKTGLDSLKPCRLWRP